MANKILFLFSFALIVVLAVMTVFEFDVSRNLQKDTITIMRGENTFQIANDLKSEGYIRSKLVFLFRVMASGNFRNLKAGVYDLKGLGYADIVDRLSLGKTSSKTITIVPGWDILDIAKYLQTSGVVPMNDFMAVSSGQSLKKDYDFLAILPENASLEGYLYPDTYQISEKPSATDLVQLMLDNFGKKLPLAMRDEIKKQDKTIFDVVTMASVLEKEVKTMVDKKVVAGILWRRLAAGMPLQVDSSLLYFKASNSVTFDKEADSPYNTYKYPGLPAGPICNPGIESIEAAIYPQESKYWYYLSAKDGTTIFSKTYDEHLANKAKYLD